MALHDENTPKEIGLQPSQGFGVRNSECVHFEDECNRRLDKLATSVKTVEEAMIEHRLRLENGSRVFTDIKQEIASVKSDVKQVEKQATPKPVDWWRIVVPVSGLLVTLLAGWWALSQQLGDRPTADQVDKTLRVHAESAGHPAMAGEVQKVREEQIKQGETLKGLSDKIEQTRVDVGDIKVDIRALRGLRPGSQPQPPQGD